MGTVFPPSIPLLGGKEARILGPHELSILGAPEKLGKSQLVLQIALRRAAEEPWLEFQTTPGTILYVNAEIGEPQLQERLKDMLRVCTPPSGRLICASVRGEDGWAINLPGGSKKLRDLCDHYHPDHVILDPMTELMWGDESDPMVVKAFLSKVIRLPGIPHVQIVHHFRKANPNPRARKQGPQEMSGSGIILRKPDSILWCEPEGEVTSGRAWLKFSLRNSPNPKPIYVERGQHQWWERAEYMPSEGQDGPQIDPKHQEGVRATLIAQVRTLALQGMDKATVAAHVGRDPRHDKTFRAVWALLNKSGR